MSTPEAPDWQVTGRTVYPPRNNPLGNCFYGYTETRLLLPGGSTATYYGVDVRACAHAVAVEGDLTTYLVRQTRPNLLRSGDEQVPQTLELPGGFVPAGTTPEEGVGKELQEEIGMRAGKLATLGVVYPSPGVSNERDHTFLATQLTPSQRSSGEETERDLEVVTMPFGQAYDMFLSSKQPVAAQTLAAMAKAARLL